MAASTLVGAMPAVRAAAHALPQRSASEGALGMAVFRGTTTLGSAARATAAQPAAGLSLDRIRLIEKEHEEQQLPVPAASAPSVDAVPIAGEPSNLLTDFAGLDAFDNLLSNGGFEFEPPDQGLCVGNGFVMESINSSVRIYDLAGTPRSNVVSQNAFYDQPPIQDASGDWGPTLTDPSCLFDPETNRWFHTVLVLQTDPLTGDLAGPNSIDIAVSRTANPTRGWNLFSIPTQNDGTGGTPDHDCPGQMEGNTGPCLGDYPQIGLDRNGFFVTTNEYALFDPGEQFMGAQMYAMSKSALASGESSVPFQAFENLQVPERNQVAFTLRAANAPGTTWSSLKHGTTFFVSGMVGIETGNPSPDYDAVTLWALTNTRSLESTHPSLKLRHRVINTLAYQIPPPASQRPGDLPLGECLNMAPCINAFGPPPSPQGLSLVDSLDGRMLGTWFADGRVWFSLGTAVEVGGQDLAGVLYGAVAPSFKHGSLRGRVQTQDYLAVEGNNLIMPSIGLDADGRGYLAFTLVGPDHFPTAAVAKVSLDRPASSVRVVQAGAGPQDGFSGYWIGGPRPRWGDYSYTAVDEQGNVWAGVEYIAQTCSFSAWIGGDLTCGGTRGAFANFATRVMELR